MKKRWNASSSPHLRHGIATRRIMWQVCLALLPACMGAVWFFGLRALMILVVSTLSAVASEALFQIHTKQKLRINDWSAVVTGLLLGLNLPSTAPFWLPMVGSFLAIVLIKEIFGGLGQNFMNPALGARTILMVSWATIMTTTVAPQAGLWMNADTLSAATPLAMADALSAATAQSGNAGFALRDLFLGNVPGMLGETSALALLLGAGYLLIRRVITWHIPVTFLGTVFLLFWMRTGSVYAVGTSQSALYQLLSGGLLLGAFFMATDYVTSPITALGKIIMGVGCGLIVFVTRAFNPTLPEGCSYAILMMNLCTPLIDRLTRGRSFGEVKASA